ncbi:MAG TPA: glycosyltransferase family 2 protein, partial [Myxococcota bacterium]|nr:glycosyltransferase family 2 protein [Myxococcota bacterium]
FAYELILSENGSTDATLTIARELARELPHIRVLHGDAPNYGRALRRGIEEARGELVVCDEIDLGDMDFYRRSIAMLDGGIDLVVGSKRHPESDDSRPLLRKAGTAVITTLLRVSVGFKGTDTHGLKAFRRSALMPIVAKCVVEHDIFASELVVRASRAKVESREIPLRVREIRPPSIHLVQRVPRVLKNLVRLAQVIHFPPDDQA